MNYIKIKILINKVIFKTKMTKIYNSNKIKMTSNITNQKTKKKTNL